MTGLKFGIIFSLLALTSCAHIPEQYAPESSAKFKREPRPSLETDGVSPSDKVPPPPAPEADKSTVVLSPTTPIKAPSGIHGDSGNQKLTSKSSKATTDKSSVPENNKENPIPSGTKGDEEDLRSAEGDSRDRSNEDKRRPRKYRRRYYDDRGSRRRYRPGRYYDDYYSDSDSDSYESDEYYPYRLGRNFRRGGYRRGRYGKRSWRYGRSLRETNLSSK